MHESFFEVLGGNMKLNNVILRTRFDYKLYI